jgi:hypothetical protein
MTIGSLRPGVAPERVLPTAAAAASELTIVEASSVNVVAGSARVTVRFTADSVNQALEVGGHVVTATAVVAEPVTWVVTERIKGRWYPRR